MDASNIGVIFDCDGTLLDSMGVCMSCSMTWRNAQVAN